MLDINPVNVNTVEDALDGYFSAEILDVCFMCNKELQATKSTSMHKPPKVLCVQLKRFTETGEKIVKRVEIALRINVQRYLAPSSQSNPTTPLMYKLIATITHHGTCSQGGHYTAMAETASGTYYRFDDSEVRPVPKSRIADPAAYLLFFEMELPGGDQSESTGSHNASAAAETSLVSLDSGLADASCELDTSDAVTRQDSRNDLSQSPENGTPVRYSHFVPMAGRTSTPTRLSPQRTARRPAHRLPAVPENERTPFMSKVIARTKLLRRQLTTLRKKCSEQRAEMRVLRSNSDEAALATLKDKVSPLFFTLLQCQLRNNTRRPQGRRYTQDEKLLFVSILKRGARGLRSLPFVKPTRKTLRESTSTIEAKPGLNDFIFAALESTVQAMDPGQRDCTLVLDEVALRMDLTLSETDDLVKGFVDLGGGDRRHLPATEALVAMVRSLFGTWKYAVSFWFTNQKLISEDYAGLLPELIRRLRSTGLRVRVMITDGLSKNLLAALLLGTTKDSPWFCIDGIRVYYAVDVPHLLKCLRNAILKYPLKLADGSIVQMAHLTAFILMDMQVAPRIAPKVNLTHCSPNSFQRMSVPLAAQLFDHPVAAGVATYASVGRLPREAAATALWVERIGNFFASFNGVVLKERQDGDSFKVAVTERSGHEDLWTAMIEEMRSWSFVNSPNLPFVESWILTTSAFLLLWADLKSEGHAHFPVGHANQDCLENFFSLMRILLGHLHNPSAAEFPWAFSTAMVNSFTGTGKKKNCRDDDAIVLVHFKTLYEAAAKSSREKADDPAAPEPETNVPPQQFEDGIAFNGEMQEEAMLHLKRIAGAQAVRPLLQKFLVKALCEVCARVLVTVDVDEGPASLASFPTTAPDLLASNPSQSLLDVVNEIYELCGKEIPRILHRQGLLAAFHKKVLLLPSVLRFRLCEAHNDDTKTEFLKEIERDAVKALVSKTSRALHDNRGRRGSRKLQRVSHR